MKRYFLRLSLVFAFVLIFASFAIAASGKTQETRSEAKRVSELKRMSVFLSNFTELGFMEFDTKDLISEDISSDIIRFGIWHNFVKKPKRTAKCKVKDCKWGSLRIRGKHVAESVKIYFGTQIKLDSIMEPDTQYHYDGKFYHFDAAKSETTYHARVDEMSRDESEEIVMTGELYNVDENDDILGKFEATAKPHKYGRKKTWAIVSMKTEYY
jgi:hypothetical protein